MTGSKFATFGFCLLLALSTAGSGLTFTNALLDKNVAPGEEIYHEITIALSGNETAMSAVGGIYDYGMGLDGARIPLVDDKEMAPYSAVGFLRLTPENAMIEPGKPAKFVIEGRVPEDVGSGGRYALVEIHTPPQGAGQVRFALATIVPIRLTISGTELIETGEITDLNATAEEVYLIFKNTGNHHFKASARADLRDEDGKIVSSAEAPLMDTPLVPTASYLFKMTFKGGTGLAPGRYTAVASVIHENGTVLDTEEVAVRS